MAVKDEYELLERLSKTEHRQPNPDSAENAWEALRLALEGADDKGRRQAAMAALRFWRRLSAEDKDRNVRLLSGLWGSYFLQQNRTAKVNLIGSIFLREAERAGSAALRAEGLLAHGLYLLATGKPKEAIETWELARALFTSTRNNPFDVVRSSILLGSAFRVVGDRASCVSILGRARQQCLEMEEVPLLASISLTLGLFHIESGDFKEATRCLKFAQLSSSHFGSWKRALRADLGLAIVSSRSGHLEDAMAKALTGLKVATQLQLPREICLSHELLGNSYLQLGDWKKALWHLSRMNKAAVAAKATADIGVELHKNLAELWIRTGHLRRAALHIKRAKALAANSVGKEDCVALERLSLEVRWKETRNPKVIEDLCSLSRQTQEAGYGFESLIISFDIVQIADDCGESQIALEWWSRVEYLAKSCEALPLLERWRKERQEKGHLPTPVSDVLEEESSLNSRLARELPPVDLSAFNIITRSRKLHEQAASIRQIAPTKVPVLIHGESGTGKELFARLVHDLGPRNTAGFLALNCGALPSELLESELFGHRRGAFTGAVTDKVGLFRAAHNGTLFLDEIGEMSAPAQTKLLRVLEVGELRRVGDTQIEHVDVRIVAATNVDLEDAVSTGKFRRDLYYRLKGLEIFLPPLRERLADIPILAEHFLELSNTAFRKKLYLPFETRQWLMGQPWMGNVRELRLAVERAAALGPAQGMLQPYHFMNTQPQSAKSTLADELEEIERVRVLHALEASNWNKAGAAKLLGMSRTTLLGKIKRLGIEDPESRD